MVPRTLVAAAIAKLRVIGDRIDRHLWATEIRSMAGDRLWLSPAYGGDCVGIHFSWQREFDAVQAMTAEIEALLLPLGARPIGARSCMRASRSSHCFIRNCPRFGNSPSRTIRAASSAMGFLDVHVFG